MASALWSKIQGSDEDGGLKSCFAAANLPESIVKVFRGPEYQFETLRDFATSFTEEDYVQALDEVWQADEESKTVRAVRGRLHSAWKAAMVVINNAEKGPSAAAAGSGQVTIDWEAPLDDHDLDEMNDAWSREYKFKFDTYTTPGDPLINRTRREFRKWSMTVSRVEKWKSVLHERQPEVRHETALSSNCAIVENLGTIYVANSLLDYYWGLRVLVNAWGKAGNYTVDSKVKEGLRVKMMPWDIACSYADRCLRIASASEIP